MSQPSPESSVRIEQLLERAAARAPEKAALIYGERVWTYGALRAEVDRRALALISAGLRPGTVIAATERVTDEVVIAFLAACRADITFLHLSPTFAVSEIATLARRGGATCILTAHGEPHTALPDLATLPVNVPDTSPVGTVSGLARGSFDSIAALQVTSDTTRGTAKLVRQSHHMHTWLCATPTWWEIPEGVYYLPRPNALAIRLLAVALGLGATVVLSDTTEPRQMEREMAMHRVTSLWAVPAIVHLLTEHRSSPTAAFALQFVRTSTAPLSQRVQYAAAQRYGATIVQEYGSAEGGSMIGTPQGTPVGSIGKPYPGVAVRLVDVQGNDVPDGSIGELIVQSPGLMEGYLDDSEAEAQTLREGWLWTGDLAYRDAAAFSFLAGRRTLRINVGGFKVAPEEVEMVLMQHPAVREVAVLGMPDAIRGEVVRAIIVPNGTPPTIAALRAYCHRRLAGYKVPRRWEFRDALPRSPLGKILRQNL